ncbi:MAG: SpoIVB peptidase [Candidatus Scatovivens sp.]
MKVLRNILIIFLMLIIYAYFISIEFLPDEVTLLSGERYYIKTLYGTKVTSTSKTSTTSSEKIDVNVSLFGKLDLKTISVNILEDIEIVPVGKIIGLKLYTNGVLVVGMSEIENMDNQMERPFDNADIKEGDTIIKVNNTEIDSIESLKKEVNNSNGNTINLTLVRDGSILTSNIIPTKTEENEYKLGLWVRDAATGVGTITYYEPESKQFAALGHGITDTDTDKLIDIESGELVTSNIVSIKKGESGKPGEIKGSIINQLTIGNVTKNSIFGIYGDLTNLASLNIDTSKSIKVALRNEIKTGSASIICNINGAETKEYSINIDKIYYDNDSSNKSFIITVTDKELIERTGGIIRGLSGAPIIQNGKFVGAVTNVLVQDPKIGYGVFADLMIKEMKK